MTFASVALWIVLLAATVTCAYWHYHTNKALIKDSSPASAALWYVWLGRLKQTRTLHLLVMMACYSLLIVCYDWQLQQSKKNVLVLETAKLDLESQNTTLKLQNTDLADMVSSTLQPPPPEMEAAAPSPSQNISPAKEQDTVLDVYNPEESLPGNQPAMDALKKRYEEILVTHLFLKKCKIAQPVDYHIIISALSQEMASINAPGRLQHDIVTAARGSYKELYAQSSCSGDNMSVLRSQYTDYINGLSQTFVNP